MYHIDTRLTTVIPYLYERHPAMDKTSSLFLDNANVSRSLDFFAFSIPLINVHATIVLHYCLYVIEAHV